MNRSHQTLSSDAPDRQGQHPRGASPDLQSRAGNRAVTGLLRPRNVQRFGLTDALVGPLAGAAAGPVMFNGAVDAAVNPIVHGIEDVVGHLPFLGDLFGGDAKAGKSPPAKPQPAPAPAHPSPPAPVPMPNPTAIDGIPGESTDDKHKDWIELLGPDSETPDYRQVPW
jgi:hypothetical protein